MTFVTNESVTSRKLRGYAIIVDLGGRAEAPAASPNGKFDPTRTSLTLKFGFLGSQAGRGAAYSIVFLHVEMINSLWVTRKRTHQALRCFGSYSRFLNYY